MIRDFSRIAGCEKGIGTVGEFVEVLRSFVNHLPDDSQ